MTEGAEVFCAEVRRHVAAYRDGAAPVPPSLPGPAGPVREARRRARLRSIAITVWVVVVSAGLSALVAVVAHVAAGSPGRTCSTYRREPEVHADRPRGGFALLVGRWHIPPFGPRPGG